MGMPARAQEEPMPIATDKAQKTIRGKAPTRQELHKSFTAYSTVCACTTRSESCSWAATAFRWRRSFPGPSSIGSESEHALQNFREPAAEVAIGEEDKGQATLQVRRSHGTNCRHLDVLADVSYHDTTSQNHAAERSSACLIEERPRGPNRPTARPWHLTVASRSPRRTRAGGACRPWPVSSRWRRTDDSPHGGARRQARTT